MMTRTVALTLLWLLVGFAPAMAEGPPERAVVAVAEARVHSGPGEQFYATGQLESGHVVEVYRRKANGWCAVRPPQGSFSYVRVDHVRRTETAGIVEVARPGTKTRVGSMLKQAYQVEYVALEPGERLQVLGGPVRLGPRKESWYRISPPAGEFRWMRTADLKSDRPVQVDPAPTENLTLPAVDSTAQAPPPARAPSAPATAPTAPSLTLESLAKPRGQMATEPIPTMSAVPAAEPTIALTSHQIESSELAPPQARLGELELALSQIVTQQVGSWNLSALRQQILELQTMPADSASRRSAQQLLERLDEFAVLQARHQQLSVAEPADPSSGVPLADAIAPRPAWAGLTTSLANRPPDPPRFAGQPAGTVAAANEPMEPPSNVHYAGQGWLVPVISSLPNLPRFALTDQQGAVRAFVSARPGLNLRRYQRREVGIVGRETLSSDDQAPHLLADRVVLLDRHRR